MATTTSPISGKIGAALKFDGSTQCLTADTLGTPPLGKLQDGNTFTISSWIKIASNNSSTRWIFSKGDTATPIWGMLLNSSNQLSVTSTGAETGSGFSYTADNKWHFVSGTFDGTTIRVYIDGAFKTSYAGGAMVGSGTNNFASNIGAGLHGHACQNFFPGSIDDVRVYNRALSTQEVSQLYLLGM